MNRPDTETSNRIGQHQLSPTEFAALGLGEVAYVKAVENDGKTAFAIHGADGTPLAIAVGRDLAFAVVRQNELEPLSVH